MRQKLKEKIGRLTAGSLRLAALFVAIGLAGGAWAADAPTITVDGTTVTINNETATAYNSTKTLTVDSTWQAKRFWLPAGTGLASGAMVKVTSIAFAVPSTGNFVDKIGLAGSVSASAVRTASGFTTANADKVLFSFEECYLRAGYGTRLWFLDSNGEKVADTTVINFMLGGNSYQHIDNLGWTISNVFYTPVIEVVGEIVDGSYLTGAQTAIGNSGTDPLYAAGVTGWLDTGNSKTGPVVLIGNNDGTASIGVNNANSVDANGQHSTWSKLSGSGTLTSLYTSTVGNKSSTSPVLEVYDSSEFTGAIITPVNNGPKLSVVFCNADESATLKPYYYDLFRHNTGSNPASIYVSAGRTTANNAVVTIPANKTWTANKLLNNGEVVVDGTFTGPVANKGTLTINGTVTGAIVNSGNGTVVVNEGATIASFGSQRDFAGWMVDSSVAVNVTMTAEEYGKGSVSVTGANGISSITVLAPDGTTTVGTIVPEAGEGTLETGVKVSGLATWCDYEFNGNRNNSGVDETGLNADISNLSSSDEFYNNSMLYTYTHPWRDISYPDSWTAVVRCTVPNLENAAVIMFGTYGAGAIGLIAGPNPETDMLLVSTPGSSATTSEAKHFTTLQTMSVQNATSAQHVYVFTKSGTTVNVYCDGDHVLTDYNLSSATLGGGLQIGSLHGGVIQNGVDTSIVRFGKGELNESVISVDEQMKARIDCVRMYDYIVSADQIAALSVEFPAVKLYRATAAANTDTTWTEGTLTWTPSWDGGNDQSKIILTTEGDAAIALPASITADEFEINAAVGSTLTLSGSCTMAVTEPIDIVTGTLKLTGTVTLTKDAIFNGSVVFDAFTAAGTGALKLSNGATVGVERGSVVVTPLGDYTLAEGTVVDAAYSSGEGDVQLIPLSVAAASVTTGGVTSYYSDLSDSLSPFMTAIATDESATLALLGASELDSSSIAAFKNQGIYYDATGNTLTKAVAKIGAETYNSLVSAVTAAVDGATVTLLRASSEAITLNKAITLSETANFSGTLSGVGTLVLAGTRESALNFNNWTGTVVLPAVTSTTYLSNSGFNFNFYGITGSTVRLSEGLSGQWLTNAAVNPAVEIPADKTFTLGIFSSSFANTFAVLKGEGAFVITAEANNANDLANVANWGDNLNYSAYFRLGDVSEFTGSLTTTSDVGIALGASKPGKNTAGGKIYVYTTVTASDDWTAPNGIVLADANATLTVGAGATVTTDPAVSTTVADSYVKEANGVYSVDAKKTVTLVVGENVSFTGNVASGDKFAPGETFTVSATPDEYYSATIEVTGAIENDGTVTVGESDITVTVSATRNKVTVAIPLMITGASLAAVSNDVGTVEYTTSEFVAGNLNFTIPAGTTLKVYWNPQGNYILDSKTTMVNVYGENVTVSSTETGLPAPIAAGAMIGDNLYVTFQDAINDASSDESNPSTITLLQAVASDTVVALDKSIVFDANGYAFGGVLKGNGKIRVNTAPTLTYWSPDRFSAVENNEWTGTFIVGWTLSGQMQIGRYGISGSKIEVVNAIPDGYFSIVNDSTSVMGAPTVAPAVYFDNDVTINNGFGGQSASTTFAKVGMADGKTFATRGTANYGTGTWYAFTVLEDFDGTIAVNGADHVTIGSVTVPEQPVANTVVVKVAKGNNATLEGYPKAKYPGDQVSLVYSDSIKDGESGYYKAVAAHLRNNKFTAYFATFADVVAYYNANYQDGDAILVTDAEADGVPVGWKITGSGYSQWLTKIQVAITWDVDGDLTVTYVDYGDTPSYTGETPTRTATAQYTYAFTVWTPAFDAVTEATTYTAQFFETVNQYELTVPDVENATATVTVGGDVQTAPYTFDYGTVVTVTWTPVSSAWKVTSSAQVIELTGNVMAEEPTVAPNEKTFTVVVPANTVVTVDGQTYTAGDEITRTIGTSVTITYTVTGQFVGEPQQQVVEITGDTVSIPTPGNYVAPVPAVAEVGGVYKATLAEAVAAAQAGDTVRMIANETADATKTTEADRLVVTKAITIDFGAFTYTVPGELETSSNWSAFYIDANVTVTGTTGGINCLDKAVQPAEGELCGVYAFTVGKNVANVTLTINGGVYHGGGTVVQVDSGSVVVNGGTFSATPYVDAGYGMNFVFNCKDANYKAGTAGVAINGGTFVGFDPQDNKSEGAGTDYTAPGYIAVDDGNGTFTVEEGYVITFADYNGTVLETLRVKKGETPAPTVAPTRADDVVEAATSTTTTSYTFDGWTVDAATADATYTATYTPTVTVVNYVAQIGATKYETLQEALDVGGEVTLLANIASTTYMYVGSGKTVSLDLNGKTITSPSYGIVVWGELTVDGGTITATYSPILVSGGAVTVEGGTYTSTGNSAFAFNNNSTGGTLTVNDATVQAQEFCVLTGYSSNNTITINGGEFTSIDNAVIGDNGTSGYSGNTFNITGGTFNGGITSAGYVACGIYVANNDTVNVSGGEFNITGGCGILARAGVVNVTGGTFTTTGSVTGKVGDSRVVVPCAAIVYDSAANYPGYDEATTGISLDNVTLSSEVTPVQVVKDEGDAVTVTATSDSIVVPADYKWVETATGYSLVEKVYVARVGDVGYETLQAAVDSGDEIVVKILDDIALASRVVVSGKTVDFEADEPVTVSCASDRVLNVVNGSTVTVGQNVTLTTTAHPTVFATGCTSVKPYVAGAKTTLVINGVVENTNPTYDATFAIAGNGTDDDGVDITVNGTVRNANGIAIYQAFPGDLVINGTVEGASAISIKDGTLTVNDGAVITATLADGQAYVGNGSGESPTGDAIIAPYYPLSKGYGTPVVSILGGTITVADTANCTGIEAYDFDGTTAPQDAATNVNVEGGEFNTAVAEDYCASGYIPTYDSTTGTYGVKEGAYVARVGDVGYETLQAAVDSGDEIVVKILDDIALASRVVVSGKTVDFEADEPVTVSCASDRVLNVVNGSTVTVGQNVTLTTTAHPTVFATGCTSVKPYVAGAKTTLVINGVVENTNPTYDATFAIAGNGTDDDGVDITVNGTVRNANGIAIYQAFPGDLVINGTVEGASAISIKDGTLTVNDGAVITATLADGQAYVGNGSGESPTGDAIIAPYYPLSKGYGTPVVSILGGTITVADTANCTGIEAYDFDGTTAPQDAATNVNVEGGEFNTAVAEDYCASGYIPTYDSTTGTYGVKEGAYVARVGDVGYETLQAAFDVGGTVVLLGNVTLDAQAVVGSGKTVTLNMAGYTINNTDDIWDTANGAWSLVSVQGGSLTIQGNGKFDPKAYDCYALDVRDGGSLTIVNGTFIGNVSAVYVYDGTLDILGGSFDLYQLDSTKGYAFLINMYDSAYAAGVATASIEGGEFHNWDPQSNAAESGDSSTDFTADGYIGQPADEEGWTKVVEGAEITWVNWDDTVLDTIRVIKGDMPEYSGATPVRPEDDLCVYTFAGWTPAIAVAEFNATYKAHYTETAKVAGEVIVPSHHEELDEITEIVSVPASIEQLTAATLIVTEGRGSVEETLTLKVLGTAGWYYTWTYEGGTWKPAVVMVATSNGPEEKTTPAASEVSLTTGQGVWVTYNPQKALVLNGTLATAGATPVYVTSGYNLIAPPPTGETTYSLSSIAGATQGDKVVIPSATGGAPLNITYNGTKWGYWVKVSDTKVEWKEDAAVPAGTGFWYVPANGSKEINL